MLIPNKLTIQNYCQIPHLEIDFEAANVIAITAPIGTGKSNSLMALRYALTGLASEGANKLTDDIRDGQNSASVKLSFSIPGYGNGSISRDILKIGSNKVNLTLTTDSGERETLTKSGQAEARFQELLGVSPKYISEIIISDQYSIASPLFWPASERGPKFQRFLHGTIFADIEKLVQKERKALRLDPNAAQRLEAQEKLLSEQRERQVAAKKTIADHEKFLGKAEVKEVQTKYQQVELFEKLKKELGEVLSELQIVEQKKSSLAKEISQFPNNLQQTRDKIKQTVTQLTSAWDAFRPYKYAQERIAEKKKRLGQLQHHVQELNALLSQEKQIREQLNTIISARQRFEFTEQVKELIQESNELEKKLKSIQIEFQKLAELQKTITADLELIVPTYHLLNEALEHINKQHSSTCVLCESQMSDDRLSQFKKRYQAIFEKKQTLEQQEATTAGKLEETKKIIHTSEAQRSTLLEQIATKRKALQALPDAEWLPEYGKLLPELEAKANQLPSAKRQFEEYQEEINQLVSDIAELKKTPPAPQPSESEEALRQYQKQREDLEQQWEELNRIKTQLATLEGTELQLSNQKQRKLEEFSNQSLPNPDKPFALSERENQLLQTAIEKTSQLTQEKQILARYEGSIEALEHQITQTRKDIKGVEDTQNYLSDLEQLETWFKYNGIPSQILQQQLNNLCAKMANIVNQFQLRQSFRLLVDEDLEVFMQYPSGSIRPIQKASGGERMILGLAFRLATHQYLAPELPVLIIDEPSNHLPETNQAILQDLIRSLRSNLGQYGLKKFIYCTHSKPLAGEAELTLNLSEKL